MAASAVLVADSREGILLQAWTGADWANGATASATDPASDHGAFTATIGPAPAGHYRVYVKVLMPSNKPGTLNRLIGTATSAPLDLPAGCL